MSFKSGCYISGEVVMSKIQWVQFLIQGCDAMREVEDKVGSQFLKFTKALKVIRLCQHIKNYFSKCRKIVLKYF